MDSWAGVPAKADHRGKRSLVFHVGGQLAGLSMLPVMRLKLNALSMSAPRERTAMVTAVPTGFAERLLSFSGKGRLC